MANRIERKYFRFQVRSVSEAGKFTGYASVFGIRDSYGDVIARGAFSKTLQEQKTFPMLWSHDVMNPIGIVTAREDNRGLVVDGELNLEVQRGREVYALMRQGAVRGLSIGFTTMKDSKDDDRNRVLQEIKLWEVSLVVFPANQAALVTDVRTMGEFQEETIEMKPYPNEHAARLQDPDEFDRFRRTKDGKLFGRIKVPETIFVVWGRFRNTENEWAAQSIRFPVKHWTAEEAKKWLQENEIEYVTFEEAEPQKVEEKAEWTIAYINSLPDAAFAVIEPAYLRGDTEDKRCRHLPHHGKSVKDADDDESVDPPHLRNALARMSQIRPVTDSISADELRAKARRHLIGHAKRLEIGEYEKEKSAQIREIKSLACALEEIERIGKKIASL